MDDLNPFHFKNALIDSENEAFRTKTPVSIREFLDNATTMDEQTKMALKGQLDFEAICQGTELRVGIRHTLLTEILSVFFVYKLAFLRTISKPELFALSNSLFLFVL